VQRGPAPGERESAILLNRDLAGEPLPVIASYVVEGTLLPAVADRPLDPDRAVAITLLGTLAYADLVIAAPEVAAGQTIGTVTRNRELLALLNSSGGGNGEGAAAIGFLAAPAGVDDVLPGLYADAPSFAAFVRPRGPARDVGKPWRDEDTLAFRAYLSAAAATGEAREGSAGGGGTLAELEPAITPLLTIEEIVALAAALDLGVAA
jgi:hypothetical protein